MTEPELAELTALAASNPLVKKLLDEYKEATDDPKKVVKIAFSKMAVHLAGEMDTLRATGNILSGDDKVCERITNLLKAGDSILEGLTTDPKETEDKMLKKKKEKNTMVV